jgi:hypothetical protein
LFQGGHPAMEKYSRATHGPNASVVASSGTFCKIFPNIYIGNFQKVLKKLARAFGAHREQASNATAGHCETIGRH